MSQDPANENKAGAASVLSAALSNAEQAAAAMEAAANKHRAPLPQTQAPTGSFAAHLMRLIDEEPLR